MRTEVKIAEEALRKCPCSHQHLPRYLPPAGIREPSRTPRRRHLGATGSQPTSPDPPSADSYLLQEAQLGKYTLNLTCRYRPLKSTCKAFSYLETSTHGQVSILPVSFHRTFYKNRTQFRVLFPSQHSRYEASFWVTTSVSLSRRGRESNKCPVNQYGLIGNFSTRAQFLSVADPLGEEPRLVPLHTQTSTNILIMLLSKK